MKVAAGCVHPVWCEGYSPYREEIDKVPKPMIWECDPIMYVDRAACLKVLGSRADCHGKFNGAVFDAFWLIIACATESQ